MRGNVTRRGVLQGATVGAVGACAVGMGARNGRAADDTRRRPATEGGLAVGGPDDKGYASAQSTPSLNLPDSAALTIEFWMRHDGNSQTDAVVVEKNPDGSKGYQVSLHDDGQQPTIWFGYRFPNDEDFAVTSSSGIPEGTWTHVACTYNGDQQAIYIDGELDATRGDWDGQDMPSNDGELVVGASTAQNDRFLSGELDELRIWNAGRELLEIQENQYTRLSGDENGLVAYYPFDGSLDDQTNSNNLETTGSAALSGRGTYPVPPVLYTRAGDGAVEVTWEARGAEAQGIAEYRLFEGSKLDGSDRQQLRSFGADTTSATVDAANDAVHYYWVQAVDEDGNQSGFSYPAIAYPSTVPSGRSVTFPGDDSYVTIDDRPALDVPKGDKLSIEFWVKHDGKSDENAVLIEKNASNSKGYQVSFKGAGSGVKVWFGFRFPNDEDFALTSNAGIPKNQWTHVACTYDGQQQAIYVDGERDATRSDWDGNTTPGNDAPLRFGADKSESSRFFSGQLDEVRIWNAARNKEQVQKHYETELFGNEEGLGGYWRTCDGTQLHGSVGTAMTGAFNNVGCGNSDIDLDKTSEGDGDPGTATTNDGGGSGSTTASEDGAGSGTATTVSDDGPSRGFLFNGEQSILGFLNETLITIVGIGFSVVGILYQMVGGES